jgi:radical SAM protein with 4Fe4S-binding SPASM domain
MTSERVVPMSLCSAPPMIRNIPYSAFADRMDSGLSAERTPLEGSIELTFRCNLRCAHCYVNEPSGDLWAKRQELTLAEITRIADEVVDLGCLWMLLTGGEPLLRPDFTGIYLQMKRKGLLVCLFTNGSLITPRIADLLAEWPPVDLEISIYGSTQTVHERVTGVPGSYRQCIRGIELLLERKVHPRLKTIPMTLNCADMEGMRALATAYGLQFRWDPLVNCRVDGASGPKALRLRADQIVALDQQDPKRVAEFRKEFAKEELAGSSPDVFNCNAYRHGFHIDPYGNLLPCMMVRWPSYSLRESSFRQGWYEAFPAMRNRRRAKSLPCDTCRLAAACEYCVGWAQVETGDPQGKVPFLCEVAYARAEAFRPTPVLAVSGDQEKGR